jgi:hypothetical protein
LMLSGETAMPFDSTAMTLSCGSSSFFCSGELQEKHARSKKNMYLFMRFNQFF